MWSLISHNCVPCTPTASSRVQHILQSSNGSIAFGLDQISLWVGHRIRLAWIHGKWRMMSHLAFQVFNLRIYSISYSIGTFCKSVFFSFNVYNGPFLMIRFRLSHRQNKTSFSPKKKSFFNRKIWRKTIYFLR